MESVSLQRRSIASLSYIFGFITGIVVLVVEPKDKFIRFHALQSLSVTSVLFGLNIILGLVFSRFGIFSFLSTISGIIIWIMIISVCVIGFYRAKQGRVYKFPFFGDWAEGKVR